MRAIGLIPQTDTLEIIEIDQPTIQDPSQVLVKVLEVGVCGTDRELAAGHIGEAPPGDKYLIIGHELLGQVVEIGAEVRDLKVGDLVAGMVRHGCDHCAQCTHGAVDFCASGDYVEHGIKQLNGFMTEYIIDTTAGLIPVPDELRSVGVLLEPLSVIEKGLEQARKAFQRIPYGPVDTVEVTEQWAKDVKALVAGSGPIGMLAAMSLKAHGADVTVIDRSDETAPSSKLLQEMEINHLNGSEIKTMKIDEELGQVDLIFEATGAAEFSFRLFDALGANGVYVMSGIPKSQSAELPVGDLMKELVTNNQTVLGTINASRENFMQGVTDLRLFRKLWGDVVDRLITRRVAMEDFEQAIHSKKGNIKAVIEIAGE